MSELFVGEDRREIVASLREEFAAVCAGEGSRVVTLVAPSGWGKTRIVQEFYAQLAADQTAPAYWPARLVDEPAVDEAGPTGAIGALTTTRKTVFPRSVSVPAGAKMAWMWWGISCERRQSGDLVDALREDADQLYAHAGGLMGANPGLRDHAGRVFDIGSSLVAILGLCGVAIVAPPVAIALAAAEVGKAGVDNRDLVQRIRQWREGRKEQRSDRIVEGRGGRESEDDELVRHLVKLSEAMPLIIVLDDAHHANASMMTAIKRICTAKSSRALVIATAWGSHLGGENASLPFSSWLSEHGGDVPHRRVDLHELSNDQVRHLVANELPQAAEIAAQIAERYGGNLLGVRALLRLPVVRRAADQGRLTLDTIRDLPGDVVSLFSEHWNGLPEDIRAVLSLAATAMGTRYLPDVLAAATEAADLTSDPQAAVSEAIDPYAWVRAIDDRLHAFADPLLHEVAVKHASSLIGQYEIAAAHRAVLQSVTHRAATELSPLALETLLSCHVRLAQEGCVPTGEDASASAFALADIAGERFAYSEAIRYAQIGLDWERDPYSEPARLHRAAMATWTAETGRHEQAVALFSDLRRDIDQLLGSDHPEGFDVRRRLALAMMSAGRPTEAAAIQNALLDDQVAALGETHLQSIVTADDLANNLAENSDLGKALVLLERLPGIYSRAVGPENRLTLYARANLALRRGDAGDRNAGAQMLSEVISDSQRYLGNDDPDTLRFRSAYVAELVKMADHWHAVDIGVDVLERQIRVLGVDHPDTLAMRQDLLIARAEIDGRESAAETIEALAALLEDCRRVLGPDHPRTLHLEANLASEIGLAGDTDRALEGFRSLIRRSATLFGAERILSLGSINAFAIFLASSGQHEEAQQLLDEVKVRQHESLKPDDPTVLGIRNAEAIVLWHSGDLPGAIRSMVPLWRDFERALGPDAPNSLIAGHWLVKMLLADQRYDAALARAKGIVATAGGTLVPHHPLAVELRVTLAQCLFAAGREDESVELLSQLSEEMSSALGADSPRTIRVLGDKGAALGQSGRVRDAIALFEDLVERCDRSMGADAPRAREVRQALAFWKETKRSNYWSGVRGDT